jgi:two-component system sensor histidine kinase KdpD
MTEDRPTPEQMLARVQTEGDGNETPLHRGRLKLFFGYAAGVGKTYAMLQAAQALKSEGKDVVVGYVEPHGRPETEALLEGLELLPTQKAAYRGTTLNEFDLDAALVRRPEVILVDELAHTNAPGMRHAKRWQDVEELLAAGVHVYSTVNVQHVESLNDVVEQISGITIRETFPDEVFERADDIALVDIPPDELLERLRQGKVYIPEQAAHALERFFRKDNLLALREIALRHTADRVREDVELARRGRAVKTPWPTSERLLVCVGPSPSSAKVVRAAKRLADRMDADWIALYVETPATAAMTTASREQLNQNVRLAESLGAEVVLVSGRDIALELISYANSRNVTKIVAGKSDQSYRRQWFRTSLVDQLVGDSGDIDVFVVRGVEQTVPVESVFTLSEYNIRGWIGTALSLAAATLAALGFAAINFGEANLVMVYLLAVVFVATRYGTGPSIGASIGAVLLFDLLFTQPYYWVTVHDTQYIVTFAVMLGVGILASTLTSRIRYQATVAQNNERRTEALYRLSRRLTAISDPRQLVEEAERVVGEVFDAHAVVFLPDANRRIRPILGHPASFAASAAEFSAAQWVLDNNQPAGAGTNTLPSTQALYVPMSTPNGVVGVLAVQTEDPSITLSPDARHLLTTYATQIAFAIERERLGQQTKAAELRAETEQMRSSLLSAVSHDLRTPLAAIAGAGSTLIESLDALNRSTRNELLETICDESQRLSRLVENLLHLTRLSQGRMSINRQWHPLDEVIGSALRRIGRDLDGRIVQVDLPDDLPLGQFDDVLVEQLLINLLDNAIKYSDDESPIEIIVQAIDKCVLVEIADRGRGLAPGDETRVFELFYRGDQQTPDRRGSGMGLAICKAIVAAHGGNIEARNRPGGGAVVRFSLPFDEEPPFVNLAEAEARRP